MRVLDKWFPPVPLSPQERLEKRLEAGSNNVQSIAYVYGWLCGKYADKYTVDFIIDMDMAKVLPGFSTEFPRWTEFRFGNNTAGNFYTEIVKNDMDKLLFLSRTWYKFYEKDFSLCIEDMRPECKGKYDYYVFQEKLSNLAVAFCEGCYDAIENNGNINLSEVFRKNNTFYRQAYKFNNFNYPEENSKFYEVTKTSFSEFRTSEDKVFYWNSQWTFSKLTIKNT